MTRRERPDIAWYGDMDLGPHLAAFLARRPPRRPVDWGAPIPLEAGTDRKRARPWRRLRARAVRRGTTGRPPLGSVGGPSPGAGAAGNAALTEAGLPRAGRRRDERAIRAMAGLRSAPITPGTDVEEGFVKSYGCQMNVYDPPAWPTCWRPRATRATARAEEADLVILNTCHIREKAAEKVYSELGRLRVLKEERAEAGPRHRDRGRGLRRAGRGRARSCAAQPAVDVVVGPQSYHRLPDLLRRAAREARGRHRVPASRTSSTICRGRARGRSRGVSAFLTVQEGCDKFCAFCVVPYTRGAEVSRPVAAILDEARRLVRGGVREITLIGQNVNAYHGDGRGRRGLRRSPA